MPDYLLLPTASLLILILFLFLKLPKEIVIVQWPDIQFSTAHGDKNTETNQYALNFYGCKNSIS